MRTPRQWVSVTATPARPPGIAGAGDRPSPQAPAWSVAPLPTARSAIATGQRGSSCAFSRWFCRNGNESRPERPSLRGDASKAAAAGFVPPYGSRFCGEIRKSSQRGRRGCPLHFGAVNSAPHTAPRDILGAVRLTILPYSFPYLSETFSFLPPQHITNFPRWGWKQRTDRDHVIAKNSAETRAPPLSGTTNATLLVP